MRTEMRTDKVSKNTWAVYHPSYSNPDKDKRLLKESSLDPSSLWVGQDHHLSRSEVEELINFLHRWLRIGRLRND
jgi:hypothetical protein